MSPELYHKMNILYCFLIGYLLSGYYVTTTSYDQRQTGEFNVQVDLKDVQIIALMKGGKEEYVDYDYAYDYSEMTIKPQNRTTPKPLNVSMASDIMLDNTTTAATTAFNEHTTSIALNKTSHSPDAWNTNIFDYITTVKNLVETENVTETSVTAEKKNITKTTESLTNANCKKGFVLNQKGECELKLQGTGNALLKLVKLSQKLKLKRENKNNPEDE